MKANSRFLTVISKPVLGLAAVLTITALGLWIYQLNQGLGITGLTQDTVWGMYIAGFFTAAGAGAGILFLGGISILLGKERMSSDGLFRLFSSALACFIAAGVLILMDIGKISHIFSMIFSLSYASSMTQDFWALTLCMIVTVWGLFQIRSGRSSLTFGLISILASLGLVLVEGLMLSRVSAHSFWGSGTIAGFLVSMIVAGCALALLVLKRQTTLQIRKALITGLFVSALLTITEILTLTGSTTADDGLAYHSILSGTASPVFWVYILGGVLVPILLLMKCKNSSAFTLAAVLALLGVLAEKLWVLIAGLEHPLVAIPGRAAYHLSAAELLAVIGTAGLGVLAYVVILGLFSRDAVHQSDSMDLTQ